MTETRMEYDNTEAGTIAALARESSAVELHTVDVVDGIAGGIVQRRVYGRGSDGELTQVDTIDVAELRHQFATRRPDRLTGTVQVHTPQSLVDYADRHLDVDASTLWGDVDQAMLTVVLNGHGHGATNEEGAAWCDHRAVLKLRRSPEWEAWASRNEKGMSQEELAEFLEEHLVEVVDPDGSTLLEVTRTFQATTGATFRRAQSLHSGQVQLTWQEDGQAQAGASGQLEVPREFTIRLRPFGGAEPVDVRGMFRYRVSSGQLVLGFRLLNLDEITREAVENILGDVASDLGLTPFEGVAPAALR